MDEMNEQEEFDQVDDETLDGVEAQLSPEDAAEDEQDFNDYAAADKVTRDKETAEFLAVTAGDDVNLVEFADLRSEQLAELGDERFTEYLKYREQGGDPPSDTIDEEREPGVVVPDWGVASIVSDEEFEKKVRDSYGIVNGPSEYLGVGGTEE
jgi:hypothetical protein